MYIDLIKLEKELLSKVEVIHGQKMLNISGNDFPFADASGDFIETLKASNEVVDLLTMAFEGDKDHQEAFFDDFKQEYPDILIIGNIAQKNSFGQFVSVPVLDRSRQTFKYWEFK